MQIINLKSKTINTLKYLLLWTIVYGLWSAPAMAQPSEKDRDPNQLYYQAVEYMQLKNFAYAKDLLEQFLNRKEVVIEKQYQTLRSNAKFYRAVCALELGQPDAEKLFLD